jgi:putative membrane protein
LSISGGEDRGPLRDELAASRTHLAAERTFLAYVRTSIMLGVSGVTLIKLLKVGTELVVLGYALLPLSAAVAVVGIARYLRTRKAIEESQDECVSLLSEAERKQRDGDGAGPRTPDNQ